jgi:hypothetical protein
MSDQPYAVGEGEEEGLPSEEERREAALLARALEGPGGALEADEDPAEVEGPLGAARLLQAARKGGLDDLRERAVLLALQPQAPQSPAAQRRSPRAWRLAAALGAACAAVALLFWAGRPQPRAALPLPSAQLLQAQLQAARPGAPLAPLEAALDDHRQRLLGALQAGYGRPR